MIEDNPNQTSGKIPFVTYFVTNYLGDKTETAKHERILEEQLIKDFELMGDQLELVDDYQQLYSSAQAKQIFHQHRCSTDEPEERAPQTEASGGGSQIADTRPDPPAGAGATPAAKAISSQLSNLPPVSRPLALEAICVNFQADQRRRRRQSPEEQPSQQAAASATAADQPTTKHSASRQQDKRLLMNIEGKQHSTTNISHPTNKLHAD